MGKKVFSSWSFGRKSNGSFWRVFRAISSFLSALLGPFWARALRRKRQNLFEHINTLIMVNNDLIEAVQKAMEKDGSLQVSESDRFWKNAFVNLLLTLHRLSVLNSAAVSFKQWIRSPRHRQPCHLPYSLDEVLYAVMSCRLGDFWVFFIVARQANAQSGARHAGKVWIARISLSIWCRN